MWATISTSPDRASVTTQVTSPSASNFGAKARPSSTSSADPRWAKGESWSDKNTSLENRVSQSARTGEARQVGRERYYIGLLRGLMLRDEATPWATVAVAQRSLPRTMVMKRT